MGRTIFFFAMVATLLVIVLVNVARVPASGGTSFTAAPAQRFSWANEP